MEVKFGFTFDEAPHVVVQLAAVDASKGKGRRFETWASDESCEGFRLHARTWEDSVTWTLKVSWLATSEPVVQGVSCRLGSGQIAASRRRKPGVSVSGDSSLARLTSCWELLGSMPTEVRI